jgi:ribosomal protein S1
MTKKAKTKSTAVAMPTNPMELLLQKTKTVKLKKGAEIEATIISISKKGTLFDIGAKAYAVLGEKELKEISTYLPYLKVGEKVQARVISEESKEGFPVLSLRKFFENGKWEILKIKKEKEAEIEVVCGEYGKGGVFIDFMGIRGVIPKIQLSEDYLQNPEKLSGQKIKVKILEVDEKKNRLVVSQKIAFLKISQKELMEGFDKIEVSKVYKATVLGVSEFGIFCEVAGVEGLIHISEISWEKVSDPSVFAKIGDKIDVVVVEKNVHDLKLNLSIKRLSQDPWETIEEKYPKDKEVKGEVVRQERYGYFVRLEPGIEGLVHISKLTGKEDLKLGTVIKAYIEKAERKSRKMSLILTQSEKPVTYR